MATYDDPKYKELDYKHRQKLDEIRERQQQKIAELNEKMRMQSDFDLAETEAGFELERLRHEIREAERIPDFEDFRKRAELEFLIRRQERLDQNQMDNRALERKITELRSLNRHDIQKLALAAAFEHLHGEAAHLRTVAELRESVEAEMMKAEQSHRHKLREDDNASRLRVSEMFSARFLDYVFSQIGEKSAGLSREDLENLVDKWEQEGDNLKK